MARDWLSAMWSAISVGIVAGLSWFLWDTRRDQRRLSGIAALGIGAIFVGLLCAQFYNWSIASDPPTGLLWLGFLAAILATSGGATVVWSFRPRKINGALWMGALVLLGLVIALLRIYPPI